MNLWLDDIRPAPKGFIHVKTAWEAIRLLETGKVTGISFDHDLGNDAVYGTGYDVALYIEKKAFEKAIPALTWRIHSANIVGADKIRAAMNNATRFWEK